MCERLQGPCWHDHPMDVVPVPLERDLLPQARMWERASPGGALLQLCCAQATTKAVGTALVALLGVAGLGRVGVCRPWTLSPAAPLDERLPCSPPLGLNARTPLCGTPPANKYMY